MGKQRITQLLDQLQANQQRDLQNAAAIFTVAQVAVNQLEAQLADPVLKQTAALPAATALLPVNPAQLLDRAELERRYGSHLACRKAAKALGIKFSKTPSWKQLVAAFTYQAVCQQMIQTYLQEHPSPDLQQVSIQIKLDNPS